MSFYNIVDKTQHQFIESQKILETTTMDAIAFIPAHLGVIKAKVKDLAKKKLDWGIEILEQEDGKEVKFENELSISVPNQYWETFCSIFSNKLNNDSYLNLREILNEEIKEEMEDLRREVKVVLAELLDSPEFERLNKSVDVWRARFGVISYERTRREDKIAILQNDREKFLQKIYGEILHSYGEDKGNLEMIIEAIRDKRPLNTFKPFDVYDYLYGVRIRSRFQKEEMVFEALLDMTYKPVESIYINNVDLAINVEEESKEVKLVKNIAYPTKGTFPISFFKELQEIIEDFV